MMNLTHPHELLLMTKLLPLSHPWADKSFPIHTLVKFQLDQTGINSLVCHQYPI